MPTAPRFHVTQDAAFVYVHVHVPYVRVSEMEFHVDGVHFSFYCKPYLLKLHFPHAVVDDELAKAVYDPNKDNGTIVVHLPKLEPGLEFPDLDLLTKLLQPKKTPQVDLKAKSTPAPLIEVIQSTSESNESSGVDVAEADAASGGDATLLELEKRFAQVAEAEEESHHVKVTNLRPRYGFNNAYTDVFRGWHGDTSEILSLPNPEETPVETRRSLREAGEEQHFDVERYLLDFANAAEDEYLEMAMKHVPHWRQHPVVQRPIDQPKAATRKPVIIEVVQAPSATAESVASEISSLSLTGGVAVASAATESSILTDVDRELLLKLPNKEFLITHGSRDELLIFGGLVDILIGYVYEQLTTQGDSGIESAWTISILSPTLSWLDTNADMFSIVRTGVRRMLTFPLLRQFELAAHVVQETIELLRRGKRVVLHSLLDVYRIVEKSETQYLLNSIYIQDYCIWIQSVSDEQLLRLADEMAASLDKLSKGDSGWALEEMEQQLMDDGEDGGADETSGESASDSDESSDEGSSSEEEEGDVETPRVDPPASA